MTLTLTNANGSSYSTSAAIRGIYAGEVQPYGRCMPIMANMSTITQTGAGPAVTALSANIDYIHGGATPKNGSMLLSYTVNGATWTGDLLITGVSP
jgi:hypothetical protein